MAINSERRRRRALSAPRRRMALPLADGVVSVGDRAHVLGVYVETQADDKGEARGLRRRRR